MKKLFKSLNVLFILLIVLSFFNISHSYAVQTTSVLPKEATKTSSNKASHSRLKTRISDDIREDKEKYKEEESQSEEDNDTEYNDTEVEIVDEELSVTEKFISGDLPDSVSTEIKQFGYDLFKEPSSIFSPDKNVPVGHEYVIGPEDEIKITVWGKVEGEWEVKVSRDGNIVLPKIGVIGVAGLTFPEMKNAIYNEFSRYYTGFQMNVTMGALRTLRVYIVGNAKYPGAYTVSSLSSLVSALFEAGGPSKTGSMRDIQLKRNGKTITHFDLYDLLLKGDKVNDVRLLSEDVIFIPPIGPVAGIAGNVRQPAIYELKGKTRLLQLIDMAGGLTSIAFKGRVQIQRVENYESRVLFEEDLLDNANLIKGNFPLKDGDLVKIFSVTTSNNTIKLNGAVAKEGDYAIISGKTTIKDLVLKAGGILYYTSSNAELTRTIVTQEGPVTKIININIFKAMEGDPEHNIPLQINDTLFVQSVPEWGLYQNVTISGEVKFPGTYTITKGEKLSSLIKRAGGFTDTAYLRGAVFTRDRVKEIQQQSIDQMTQRLERELFSESSMAVAGALSSAEVKARNSKLAQKTKFIETLKEIEATGRMTIVLAHPRLLKGSDYDIELEEGDNLFIPKKNSVVNVLGSVMSRGSFIYTKNSIYKDYINLAGGYTKHADKSNIYVLKVDGTAKKLSSGLFNWNDTRSRWEIAGLGQQKDIEPGDSIVVPEKLERIAWMREIKDITQILYRIAVAAAVVVDITE